MSNGGADSRSGPIAWHGFTSRQAPRTRPIKLGVDPDNGAVCLCLLCTLAEKRRRGFAYSLRWPFRCAQWAQSGLREPEPESGQRCARRVVRGRDTASGANRPARPKSQKPRAIY